MNLIISKLTSGEVFAIVAIVIIGVLITICSVADSVTRIWRKPQPVEETPSTEPREMDTAE